MLRAINLYLIVASVVNLVFLFKTLVASLPGISVVNLFLTALIISAVGYCLYSNLMLILKENRNREIHFLRYNFWYNIAQVPMVLLWGFTYILSLGTELMPCLVNNGDVIVSWRFELFSMQGRFFYESDQSTYFLGINLVPLSISVFLNRMIEKHRRLKEDEIIQGIASE